MPTPAMRRRSPRRCPRVDEMAQVSAGIIRIGSAAAIAGAVVLVVATMLHPMRADPADAMAAFTEYAADRASMATHLAQFLGVALIFVGLHALRGSLVAHAAGATGAWLADLGLSFALAALAVAAVLQAIDGVALKATVDHWAAAAEADKRMTFAAAFAVRQVEIGAAGLLQIVFGTAGALFGAALVASPVYPHWLGWVAVGAGLGTAVGGVLTTFTGFSPTGMSVSMPFNLVLIAWVAAIGILMWRYADQHGGV